MKRGSRGGLGFVLAAVLSCASGQPAVAADDIAIAPAAREYADVAFAFIASHAYSRGAIDWPQMRAIFESKLAGARRADETYPAIRWMLAQLGDGNHSQLWPRSAMLRNAAASSTYVNAGLIAFGTARIGYIEVPGFYETDDSARHDFAQSLHAAIVALHAESPCGWIVDLRAHRGGTMWPMLAGLSPFLARETVGYFLTGDGRRLAWTVEPGMAVLAGEPVFSLPDPEGPTLGRASVAVLVGERTVSAGEAVAVAFRGRPGTRLFGQRTEGMTSGNIHHVMPDGAVLLVASTLFVDRTGRVFAAQEGVVPDVTLAPDDQEAMAPAKAWLASACAARGERP